MKLATLLLIIAATACAPRAGGGGQPLARSCPPKGGRPDGTGAFAFDSTEVDHDAQAELTFAILQNPGRPGYAIARFVIDTNGRADARTLTIEPGADSAIGAVVLAYVPKARFQPAVLQGCHVRVWARWPFTF